MILTKRELEVVALILRGNSSKEVAEQLFVNKRTIDYHLEQIYRKFHIKNRVQLVGAATGCQTGDAR